MKRQITNSDDYFLACRHDFTTFVGMVFTTLWPGKPYLHNWHIEAMAAQLMKTQNGECTRLIVNMPPRMLKSVVMSVAWPAWMLGHNTSAEIMCISYGDDLVKDLGSQTLTLMQSERYRRVFPNVRLHKRSVAASDIRVIGGGRRLGISAGGQITGRGGNIIIIDDPIKASDARTKQRESINTWFDENIYQRLNNKNSGVIILVMQRLHLFDLTGYLLDKQDGHWNQLCLPAIAEDDEEYELSDGRVYLRRTGEILHPAHESQEMLSQVKKFNGAYNFASQYQQQPASEKEAIIRKEWFVIDPQCRFPKKFNRIVVSWDTAIKIDEHNDYSVGVVIGVYRDHYYILDVIRKKLAYPDLLKKIKDVRMKYKSSEILVEDCASGHNIIQSLRADGIPVKSYKPHGDKFIRLSGVSGIIESGLMHLLEDAPWLSDFLLEITRFPNAAHDDQVDALSQGLKYLSENNAYNFYKNL